MNDDIKTLFDFIDSFGPEVAGRVRELPPPEAAEKLDRFARGKVSNDERRDVCTLLQRHPVWVRYVAERMIEFRKDGTRQESAEG